MMPNVSNRDLYIKEMTSSIFVPRATAESDHAWQHHLVHTIMNDRMNLDRWEFLETAVHQPRHHRHQLHLCTVQPEGPHASGTIGGCQHASPQLSSSSDAQSSGVVALPCHAGTHLQGISWLWCQWQLSSKCRFPSALAFSVTVFPIPGQQAAAQVMHACSCCSEEPHVQQVLASLQHMLRDGMLAATLGHARSNIHRLISTAHDGVCRSFSRTSSTQPTQTCNYCRARPHYPETGSHAQKLTDLIMVLRRFLRPGLPPGDAWPPCSSVTKQTMLAACELQLEQRIHQ
jgi:hypothetical protein